MTLYIIYPLASSKDYTWNGYIDTYNIKKVELYFANDLIATSINTKNNEYNRYSFFESENLKCILPYRFDIKVFNDDECGIPIYINSKIWIKCALQNPKKNHYIRIVNCGIPIPQDVINISIKWQHNNRKKIDLTNNNFYFKDTHIHNIIHLDIEGNAFLVF
jgi:hypothetical protein